MRYRSLFTSLSSAFILLDVDRDEENRPRDYRIVDVNPVFCESLRRNKDELLGLSVLELFSGTRVLSHDFEHWWTGLELAASEGHSGVYHIETKLFKDAPYQEVIIFPSRTNQIGILMNDETSRVQSERALRLMQLVIDHISEPVFWLALDGTITYCNQSAFQTLGFTEENSPLNRPVWEIDIQHSKDTWKNFIRSVRRKKACNS